MWGMHCPFCRHPDSRVIDSRTADDGASIRRRRECTSCRRRFSTIESFTLTVMKRSGIRKSCQGRPVTEDQIKALAQSVEEQIRTMGSSIVDTGDIGTAILGPLRELDTVAYLRFASVYSSFNSLDDFENAIAELRIDPAGAAGGEAHGTGGPTT